jgi:methyl-accepting chemotaxis protein
VATAKYNIDAIRTCVQQVQDYAPKFGEVSDRFAGARPDPSAYGQLPSSGAVSQAVDQLNSEMDKELDAAVTKLNQVAAALDAVVTSVQNSEDNSVQRLTARPS